MKKLILLSLLSGLAFAGGKGTPIPVLVDVPMPVEETGVFYAGAGMIGTDFNYCSELDCSYEDSTYGGLLQAGYKFNEYIALEARGFRTFLDEGPLGGVPLQGVGAYVVPQYPITSNFNIYALAGYSYIESLAEGNRLNLFESGSAFSAGAGVEYVFTDSWSIFADYQNLFISSDDTDPDITAASIGVKYTF